MNIAVIPSNKIFYNNKLFDIKHDRDNVSEPYIKLKQWCEEKKIKLDTPDIYCFFSKIDIMLVFRFENNMDIIFKIIKANPSVKIIFLVTEEHNIAPLYTKDILQSPLFDIVLTWRDDIIDDKYFYKYYYPNPLRKMVLPLLFMKKKYLTIINSYKYHEKYKKGDLYVERIKAIKYFAKNSSIDLYGMGWENCSDPLIKKVYLGSIKSKIEVIKNYKFAIAFENSNNDIGGICEKIFDVMAAGCVPIYWGAPNVLDYIPENTFIDFRNFSNYQELDKYLKTINESEYNKYIKAIEKFLESDKYYQFTSKGFVDCISTAINKIVKLPVDKKSIWKIKWDFFKKICTYPRLFWNNKRFLFDLLTK